MVSIQSDIESYAVNVTVARWLPALVRANCMTDQSASSLDVLATLTSRVSLTVLLNRLEEIFDGADVFTGRLTYALPSKSRS